MVGPFEYIGEFYKFLKNKNIQKLALSNIGLTVAKSQDQKRSCLGTCIALKVYIVQRDVTGIKSGI
jgi:hypothetical protein